MDPSWRARHSIVVVMNGKNAGVVFHAFLGENFQCPHRLAGDRKSGSAEPVNFFATRVFDSRERSAQILAKLAGCQPVQRTMQMAVAGYFVSSIRNLSY